MDTSILESKLKRYRIEYKKDKNRIIIGTYKIDYLTLIGLIFFPIIIAIGLCITMIFYKVRFHGIYSRKIIAGIILLLGTGLFNLSRIKNNKHANNSIKTLISNKIKIKNTNGDYYSFDSNNIKHFVYYTKQINENTYEGTLYIIDKENRKHLIISFDDENEKYVINDLQWFSEYFIKYINLQKV